ncbi:uncharacterized protein PG986_006712 [Apiospora aurea]|uniref:Fucose-specific lectin n=1 Tax=Apiospora aurea TaxID=335848 RepID=A0ABR1QAS1_9PEZI
MSSSREEDPLFDTNKYYFPLGTLRTAPVQSGLEVPPQRDENGAAPGLQLVPDEQKHSHQDLPGLYGTRSALRPPPVLLSTGQAVQVDEYASQGLQSIDQHYQQQYQQDQQQQQQFPHDVDHVGVQRHQWPLSSQSEQPSAQWSAFPSSNQGTWGFQNQQHNYQATSSADSSLPEAVTMQAGTHPGLHPVHYANPALSTTGSSEMWPNKHEATAMVTPKTPAWRRRPWLLWVGGVIALVVVAGAVIGGVLGSRKLPQESQAVARPSSSALPGPAGGSSEDSIAPPKSLRMHSKLAATAWRDNTHTNYTLRLFYQGPDDVLRFVENTSEDKNWTGAVALDTLDYAPMKNGAIAAGVYLSSDVVSQEFILFPLRQIDDVPGLS